MRRATPYAWHHWMLGFVVVTIGLSIWTWPVQALDVAVTATVPEIGGPPANPIVQFSGRVSPSTSVNILRNGTQIQSIPTDAAAQFSATLTDQPIGQVTYELTATDTAGRTHPSLSFALNLTAGSTTVLSGIFLGPTLAVDQASLTLGGTVTATGRTVPNSSVQLTFSPTQKTYTVTSDASGSWSKVINTNEVGAGTHTIVAVATASDTAVSELSLAATLTVTAPPPTPPGPPGPPTPPPSTCVAADINCDGKINLTDFSILLYFWLSSDPSNTRVDLNGDGRVTIIDFSILLYRWSA